MRTATDREIDTVEAELKRARIEGDHESIVRLEIKRDHAQAKAFRALQRKIRRMPK